MLSRYDGRIKSPFTNPQIRIAALFGFFIFLLGHPLRSEDQLLKEYIYLDGKLLAIERQTVPAVALQPDAEENNKPRIEFAFNRMFMTDSAQAIDDAKSHQISPESNTSEICEKSKVMDDSAPCIQIGDGLIPPAEQ